MNLKLVLKAWEAISVGDLVNIDLQYVRRFPVGSYTRPDGVSYVELNAYDLCEFDTSTGILTALPQEQEET